MASLILQCLYFILPAYFANMAPVIVKKIGFLNTPLDFNRKINNKPVFGKNKTLRGLVFGIMFSIVITLIQSILYENGFLIRLAIVDYSNWLLLGLLLGLGAMAGDLVESFVKRRINYKPGRPLVPFDQLDFVIGALVFIYPFFALSAEKIILILVLSFFLHILVNHLAFYTGARKEKW